jgi:sugar/nucleoside kinase (ribokinase family)
VVFDPGPLVSDIPAGPLRRVLRRAAWLTCNAREAVALTGAASPGAAAQRLATAGAPAAVIVRTGRDGCLLARGDRAPAHVPGIPVAARDTNGAGDAHTGAFLAALAAGAGEVTAVRQANAAAAFAVTRRGPATGPTTGQLARFVAQHDPHYFT